MNNLQINDSAYINELKITLDENLKQTAWQKVKPLSNDINRYRGYLNYISQLTFIQWLNEVLDINLSPAKLTNKNLTIWEFINGCFIEVDSTRLVLIPTENQDKNSFSIAEEWLKIPELVANYYIPVEINLDDNYLDYWGYISYRDIDIYGELDNINHCVNVRSEYLQNDLNLIALEYEYGWETIPQIQSVLTLSYQEKTQLISDIKNSLFPRLSLNFSHWLAVIGDEKVRDDLLTNRQTIKLTDWLTEKVETILTKGWQNLTQLTDEYLTTNLSFSFTLSPAFAYRSISVTEIVNILETSQNSSLILNSLKLIPSLTFNGEIKTRIISALEMLINENDDEEIRWDSALVLQYLDSLNCHGGICHLKIVSLCNDNDELNHFECGLFLGILPRKVSQELSIFIRVYSLKEDDNLPSGLSLQILDENNTVFQEIISQNEDNIIQYKLWANQGEKFTIKLCLNDSYFEENFIV